MPGKASYNKSASLSRKAQHELDLQKTKDWMREWEEAKQAQEAYILAEGCEIVGIKSCVSQHE